MAEKNLISVIVPVYNVEAYLKRCVESLVHQTCESLEIILVDDGSTDASGRLCDEYAAKYTNIKAYHKANGGLSDARNYGMKVATGEYIGFVDSDDWINVKMYEILLQELIENNADLACCEYIYSDGDRFFTERRSGKTNICSSLEAMEILLDNKKYKSHAWNKLYKRELFAGIEFPYGRYYEDIFIMHRIFALAQKVAFVDENLYYYFRRENSIVHTPKLNVLTDFICAANIRLEDIREMFSDNLEFIDLAQAGVLTALLIAYRRLQRSSTKVEDERKKIKRKIRAFDHRFVKYLEFSLKPEFLVLKYSPVIYRLYESISEREQYQRLGKSVKRRILAERNKRYPAFTQIRKNEDRPVIILFGVPEYNNLGDIAIAYATKQFIQREFGEYEFWEVTENQIRTEWKKVQAQVRKQDVLLLQGGGNLNNIYREQNELREKVIRAFPQNAIILMPQSCFFEDGRKGDQVRLQIKKYFGKHRNLYLTARDELSYERMKEYFTNETLLTPDMVLSMKMPQTTEVRSGIGICLRNDAEGTMSVNQIGEIIYKAYDKSPNLVFLDTVMQEFYSLDEHEQILSDIWKKFRSCELVITDRLHGVIFSYITQTPCIAIDTNNKKIEGICKWFEGSELISFCADDADFDNFLENAYSAKNNSIELDKAFYPLIDQIRSSLSY